MGTEQLPKIKSANAMFITKKKLFLRSCLVTTKMTRVSKFPTIIRTDDKMKALHNVMPSTLEEKRFGSSDPFFRLSFTVDVSIIISVIGEGRNQCFKEEEHNLWQRQENRTTEKLFACHGNFTPGVHIVKVDSPF